MDAELERLYNVSQAASNALDRCERARPFILSVAGEHKALKTLVSVKPVKFPEPDQGELNNPVLRARRYLEHALMYGDVPNAEQFAAEYSVVRTAVSEVFGRALQFLEKGRARDGLHERMRANVQKAYMQIQALEIVMDKQVSLKAPADCAGSLVKVPKAVPRHFCGLNR